MNHLLIILHRPEFLVQDFYSIIMKIQHLIVLATPALPAAYAWGAVGHETVAYIASSFVSSETKTYCQKILSDTSADYLASVATWADSYRYTKAGEFSEPFHFIDANDKPPSSCSVNYDRDCGSDGCSISAIQNYVRIIWKYKTFANNMSRPISSSKALT